MKNKVLALIVTYNRIDDLKNCLIALKKQSLQIFDILVVNNGSNDGTKEFLDSCKDDIIVIHQENLGGAGGFYTGMKYMHENGYEWLWMMDDDGVPEEKQLQTLLEYENRFKYMNALVLNIEKPSELAFTGFHNQSVSEIQKEDFILNDCHPFNGTLIHKSIIDKIGYIKKEMFIWGDEMEYKNRTLKAGFKVATITHAIHFHPKEKGIKAIEKFRGGNYMILEKPEKLSHNYYRNLGYLGATYNGYKHWYQGLSFQIVHVKYFLKKGRIKEAYKFIKYYYRGRNNNYN